MNPRSLFIIVLKILGILVLKDLLVSVPQLVSIVLSFFRGYSISDGLFMIVMTLISIAFILGISYILLFKAGYLVTKFGLDQQLPDDLNLSLPIKSMFQIGIIVTGFVVLFFEIPELARLIYKFAMRKSYLYPPDGELDWSPFITSCIKIVLALLLIGERERILSLVESASAPKPGK